MGEFERGKEAMVSAASELEDDVVWLGGIGVVYKLAGKSTDGAFSLIEHVIKPGTMSPSHRHTREHELAFVLEGVLSAEVGGTVLHAQPGEYAFQPKGVPHTFWNEGPGLLRFLELISPAGFESFFSEGAELFTATGVLDEQKFAALTAQYGIEMDPAHGVELEKRFRVKIFGP